MSTVDGGGSFLFEMPVIKAWKAPAGSLHFEGVASSTSVDRQSERMSKRALAMMAQSGSLNLVPSHRAGVFDELGVVRECHADSERLVVRGELDGTNPRARRLYSHCRSGKRYALSVGGRVLAAHWEQDEGSSQRVRVIDEVRLEHVAICRPSQAVNPDTYLDVMGKAAEWCVEGDGSGEGAGQPEVEGGDVASAPAGEPEALTEWLGRILRRIMRLPKGLFGADRESAGAGEEPPHAATEALAAEVRDLREQLSQAMVDLDAAAQALAAKVAAGAVAERGSADREASDAVEIAKAARPEPCKSSLDGQERKRGQQAQLWKGVL